VAPRPLVVPGRHGRVGFGDQGRSGTTCSQFFKTTRSTRAFRGCRTPASVPHARIAHRSTGSIWAGRNTSGTLECSKQAARAAGARGREGAEAQIRRAPGEMQSAIYRTQRTAPELIFSPLRVRAGAGDTTKPCRWPPRTAPRGAPLRRGPSVLCRGARCSRVGFCAKEVGDPMRWSACRYIRNALKTHPLLRGTTSASTGAVIAPRAADLRECSQRR